MRLLLPFLMWAPFFGSSVAFVPTSSLVGVPPRAQHSTPNNSPLHPTSPRCLTAHPRRWAVDSSVGSSELVGDGEEKTGVIVCDHGSRRQQANDMLFEVAERYRSFAGCDVVEVRACIIG